MENEEMTVTKGIQNILLSLDTHLIISIWNEFLDDQSLSHGDEVYDLKIYPNLDQSYEEQFDEPMVLIRWVQRSKNYSSEHSYVVFNDTMGTMESFNDPCIFIYDHADDVNFWEWFTNKTINALRNSVKGE